MIKPGGLLLIVNIPWKANRRFYYSGEFKVDNQNSGLLPLIKTHLRPLLSRYFKDGIGYWYNPREFAFFKQGTEIKFYGSLFYPYRFSVVIKKFLNDKVD